MKYGSKDNNEQFRATAARILSSKLNELSWIRQLDEQFADASEAANDHVRTSLRSFYEQWAASANATLASTGIKELQGPDARQASELRDEHGRVLAMLQIKPGAVEQARRDTAAGKAIDIQEIRNVLRSTVHP